jgi:hypothetical protein
VTTTAEANPPSPAGATPLEMSAGQADGTIRSRQYVRLLIVVAVIGVLVSLAAWCILEGIYQLEQELFTHLPHALGYEHGPTNWWYVLILGIGGLVVALAISRLPGNGGHVPADGLSAGGPAGPIDLTSKGLAYLLSLGSHRGGPTFPAMFLGAAGGIMASHLAVFPRVRRGRGRNRRRDRCPAARGSDRSHKRGTGGADARASARPHRDPGLGPDLVMAVVSVLREINCSNSRSRRALSEWQRSAAFGGVHLIRVMPALSRPVASVLSLGSVQRTMTTLEGSH